MMFLFQLRATSSVSSSAVGIAIFYDMLTAGLKAVFVYLGKTALKKKKKKKAYGLPAPF